MQRTGLTIVFSAMAFFVGCGPTLRPPQISPQLLEQEALLQQEYTYKTLVERRVELQRIYTPLRLANADICRPNISPVTGMIGIDRQTLDPKFREIAERVNGLGDGVKILDIVPASPAADSGMLAGDVVTGAANGAGVMPSGWSWSGLTVPDLVKVIENSHGDPITLLVRRGNNIFPVTLTPHLGCSYPVELKIDESLNAAADGTKIIVNTGTFAYVTDDQQLAFLLGHELAHNVLRHVQKKEGNAAAGAAAGLIFDIGLAAIGINSGGLGMRAGANAGAGAYSKEFEAEADYLGLYLLARAGFDIAAAPELFRRMGTEKPAAQTQTYFSTHPSTPARAVAMQQTIAEIRAKADRHEAMLPTTLTGEVMALNSSAQQPSRPVTSAMAANQAAMPFASASTSAPTVTQPAPAPSTPPGRASSVAPRFAQLYLIKGRIVSNPPQAFTVEFFVDSGKAAVTFAGARRVDGEFELFDLADSIDEKRAAQLIKPDTLKPFPGADAKGFAVFGEIGFRLECAYSLNRANGHGEGTCADSQGNVYQLAF